MFFRTTTSTLLMGSLGLVALPQKSLAQTVPVAVALSGRPAPAGGNYSGFFNPVLNENNQVAFRALLSGTSTNGIFASVSGSLAAVALQGPAPAGGNYTNFGSDLSFNSLGQVAFYADMSGTSTSGVFVGAPGSVSALALQNTAAPAGGNFASFSNRQVINSSGLTGIRANLTGGSSTQGIFLGTPGSLQTVALQNTMAPAGGTYGALGIPVLNSIGRVAFRADLTGTSTQGIFTGVPGSLQTVALQGMPSPVGGNYTTVGEPAMNAAGTLAFDAGLVGATTPGGIFIGAPGSLQPLALVNTAAPLGGNYATFFPNLALNESGRVAFVAQLTGGSSTSGVFAGVPGMIQAAALQNTTTPDGVTFSSFSNTVQNGLGQVAFTANLTGAGVTTANNTALYAGSVGALQKVIREGDTIDVDPGPGLDLRTVGAAGIGFTTFAGGSDGRGMSFNDSGLLTYRLTFTNGTSGIFVSSVPVPEPTMVLLASGAGLGFWYCRQRRLKSTFRKQSP